MLKGNLLAYFQQLIHGNISEIVKRAKTKAIKSITTPIRQTLDLHDENNHLNYLMQMAAAEKYEA